MEDNAPSHKKVCIPIRIDLMMKCYQHSPNFPDLNPIENSWAHMKHIISKKYAHIMSQKVMQDVVVSIWNDFEDHKWDHLVESTPERIQAVIKTRGDPLNISVRLDRIHIILHHREVSMPEDLWW